MKDIKIHQYGIKYMMYPGDYDSESVLDSDNELTEQFYEADDTQFKNQWRDELVKSRWQDRVGDAFDNKRIRKFKAYYDYICHLWEYLDKKIDRNGSFNPDGVYFLHHREDLRFIREQIEKLDEDISDVYNEFCEKNHTDKL